MAATPFIDKNSARQAYEESKNWFRLYFDPIDEFERLARNKPSDKISPELPRITDGTLAAIVQEQPKRVIQQIPTGLLECHDYPEYAKIADIVMRDKLIPLSNRMGSELQKSWSMVGKAMTWGRSTSYTFFTTTNGQMHADWVIPYAKDVLTEKGKVFAPDSNVSFMRSWYTKRDLQAIIQREKALMKRDKNYKSEWDLKLLADFIEAGATAKPADVQTPAEREKGGDNGGYEVIHAFQKGVGAEFYSFAPMFQDGVALRTKKNRDPRGNIPLDHLYCNIDHSNPLGRGQVELSGGTQNLLDQQMQMFQFMSTLEMGPPLQVWGNVNKASLKFRPNALWDMGNAPNNKVEPYVASNYALQNFNANYGLLKSVIYGLNSSQDHSISAESGSPAQSKTQAGVQAAESRLGISDNYLRKQFEEWWQNQKETGVNIHFAEMTGKPTMKLDGQDLKDVAKSPAAKYLQDDILTIPYKDINKVVFKFHVDASSSEVKENTDNAEKLTEVYKLLSQDPDPQVQQKKSKVLKVLVDEIGAEGTDDLFPELDENNVDADGQPLQQPQQPAVDPQQIVQLVQQTVQEAMQAQKGQQEDETLALIKALGLKFDQLPEGARQIVLEHIGMGTDEQTPAQTKQDLEAFTQLGNADNTLHQQDMAQKQHDLSNRQADQQAQQSEAEAAQNQPDAPLTPEETAFVNDLFMRGFSEQDAEQAVVMKRGGIADQQIIQTIGAKYARA